MPDLDATALQQQEWDTIIVGTGIGGATLGYALAKAGQRVLFCEQGIFPSRERSALSGQFAESYYPEINPSAEGKAGILSRAGRHFSPIEDRSAARSKNFVPFIGAGAGGSSALYGMAMERLLPMDFFPAANYPGGAESGLPESWPIDYEDLLPWYEAAERLYRVRNAPGPVVGANVEPALQEPPALSPANERLYSHLKKNGLDPYHLPLACEFVDDCKGCQGHLCARDCKNDSVRVCLQPAIAEFGAHLLEKCQARRFEASPNRVSRLICDWDGGRITLKSRRFVLAAGALASPIVLLNSVSADWPQGLANQSGLVGRYLMRHCIDLYAIGAKSSADLGQNLKELAFNNLYCSDGIKLGSVQSFGAMPPPEVIVTEMADNIRNSRGQLPAALFSLFKPVLTGVIRRLFSRRVILATLMEDLPRKENRVMPADDQGNVALYYSLDADDKARVKIFREKMRNILKPNRYMLLKQAEDNLRIAHACGTCRFGSDEKTSVLNPLNRAHGLENLYVVDSSFFPSSGGTNPSLTIAANALRVADHIIGLQGGSSAPPGSLCSEQE